MSRKATWISSLSLVLLGCSPVGPMVAPDDFDTFTRTDGIVVRCQRLPAEVVNKSSQVNVKLTAAKIPQLATDLTAGVSIDPQRMFDTSVSTNDYRVIARQVCFDFASGVYSPAEYKTIREKILPALKTKSETGARIDSDVKGELIGEFNQKKRVKLTFHIFPVTPDKFEAAHVLYALAVAHDEAKLPGGHIPESLPLSCKEVPSCISSQFWDMTTNPLIISGAESSGTTVVWTVDVSNDLKALRVYWEMYQREVDDHSECAKDDAKKAPDGGIPFLKVVDRSGKTVPGGKCYMSYGDELIKL